MGQALYRKYRSRHFGEVVGQDHIVKTLQNSIKAGKISHAYLFTGPRGVGKTSIARILAHEVNGLAYNDDVTHLDIIEIDAASNRRIDEIRDLRDKVKIAPAVAKYKVYIIDEVHMLTKEAFNALLKTLEEPPAHCIFILATTEAHKLPETIISRTQRFEFRPISSSQAAKHLAGIAKQEKIDIEPEALDLLAEFGGGSFRDSIGYLDQLSAFGKKITTDDVRQVLGLPQARQIDQLLNTLNKGDLGSILSQLREIEQKGVSAAAVAAALSEQLRRLAAANQIAGWQIQLLSDLLVTTASERAQEALEIALLQTGAKFAKPAVDNVNNSVNSSKITGPEPAPKPEPTGNQPSPAVIKQFDEQVWEEAVTRSKKEAASIYTALRLAIPTYENNELTLRFKFPLHQKKIDLAKNKAMVSKIIEELCGASIPIKAVVDKNLKEVRQDEPVPEPTTILINNIFGGAEIMET